MSSVFEVLFLFWFVVMSLLSSWDKMDVPVELLADDAWASEDDKTVLFSVWVDGLDRFFSRRLIYLPMMQNMTKNKYDKWG